MRNIFLFSVSPVTVFAAGSLVGFSAIFSRLVAGLFALPVLVLLWAVRFARLVFFVQQFALVCFLRSVVVVASNLAFKRDAAKARRPLTLRWASLNIQL